MQQHWPGPVTLVFEASRDVPEWLTSKDGTVALRIPADQLSQDLLRETDTFLITTSANTKDQPFPLSAQEIENEIRTLVDLTLSSDQLPLSKPSRIIDCTGPIPVETRS